MVSYGRDLFARLEEFFIQATGVSASHFASVGAFGEAVRTRGRQIAPRLPAAFAWLDKEVRSLHVRRGPSVFSAARNLGGMNLVLGGSSRFLPTHFRSVSTTVLYSDTVLIPDPVMPWLESERKEEKFRHVLLLEAVHTLLHLKPLVDADLRYPPVVVFPSWEKSLETHDDFTREGIDRLVTDMFAVSLAEPLESIRQVIEFADQHPERFCEAVDQKHLLVAPGGSCDEPLEQALDRYAEHVRIWRSQEWLESYNSLPVHRRVINGIMERMAPLYHLLDNVQELDAHPLLCLEQHAHYFRLLSKTSSVRLESIGALDPRTTALVNGLGSQRLSWLGDIPCEVLAKLRLNNENAKFRERLSQAVGKLHETALNDVDRVAAEVCREIDSAILEYEHDLRLIQERYDHIHGQTAFLGLASIGAALIPALAPFLGSVAPVALAAKYGFDKINELAEKRALGQSLMGVLATADKNETS